MVFKQNTLAWLGIDTDEDLHWPKRAGNGSSKALSYRLQNSNSTKLLRTQNISYGGSMGKWQLDSGERIMAVNKDLSSAHKAELVPFSAEYPAINS